MSATNPLTGRQMTDGQTIKGKGKGPVRKCAGPDDVTACPDGAVADRKVRSGGRQMWTCAVCGPVRQAVRVCATCTAVVMFGPDETLSVTRRAGRTVCPSCQYRGRSMAQDVPDVTARQETASVLSDRDAMIRNLRETADGMLPGIVWRMIGDAVTDGLPTDDGDAWDAATDAVLTLCQERLAMASIPGAGGPSDTGTVLPDALSGQDVTDALSAWVRDVLTSGIVYRDTSGPKRGPSGRYFRHGETGWLPLRTVLRRAVVTARQDGARLDRDQDGKRQRAILSLDTLTADGTDVVLTGTPGVTPLSVHTAQMFGGITPDPWDVVSSPVLVMPTDATGTTWHVVTVTARHGLRRDALSVLTDTDRAVLAQAIHAGTDDVWTGCQTTEPRNVVGPDGTVRKVWETAWRRHAVPARLSDRTPDGQAVRRAVTAYQDAADTLDRLLTARVETDALSVLRRPAVNSRETDRRAASVRTSVAYRPVTDRQTVPSYGAGICGPWVPPVVPDRPSRPTAPDAFRYATDPRPSGTRVPWAGDAMVTAPLSRVRAVPAPVPVAYAGMLIPTRVLRGMTEDMWRRAMAPRGIPARRVRLASVSAGRPVGPDRARYVRTSGRRTVRPAGL